MPKSAKSYDMNLLDAAALALYAPSTGEGDFVRAGELRAHVVDRDVVAQQDAAVDAFESGEFRVEPGPERAPVEARDVVEERAPAARHLARRRRIGTGARRSE